MALRGDLRQVGHAQDLPGLAEFAQLAADDGRDGTADARIHLVEHHGRHAVQAERGHFDGQRNARQFAAGGHLAQRARRLAGVGGDEEFGAFAAQRVGAGFRLGFQFDLETPAAHAEFADQRADRGGERMGRLSARCAQLFRRGLPAVARVGQFGIEPGQTFAGALQCFQFAGQRIAARGQLGRGDPMLAGEVVQARQPALQCGELLRVGVQIVADAVEQAERFVELDGGRFQQGIHLTQARFVLGQPLQTVAGLLQQRQQGGCLVAVEAFGRVRAGLDQGGGMRLAAVVAVEFLDCGRGEFFALQLGQLVFQKADAVADIALSGQGFAFAQQQAPVGSPCPDFGQQAVVAGPGVEQGELAGARKQRLMFVLAVDFHQMCGQFGQLAQRRGAAVDPGARAAVGADHAAQLALALVVQFVLAQPRGGGGGVGEVEFGGQLGAFGAVADHAAVGAQAGQKAERVHHQRLAGAGLAGNDGHAGAEVQFAGTDDGEILDREPGKHGDIV